MQIKQFDTCKHKLLWEWLVLEIRQDYAIVKFRKFWLRKIPLEQLTKPEKE